MNTKLRSCPWAVAFSVLVPLMMAVILIIPASRGVFLDLTARLPYVMGFVKFALLATTGEILAGGLAGGTFAFPKAAPVKAAVWGLIGMMLTLLIPVYAGGVAGAQGAGVLFGGGSPFWTALLTSTIMNLTFGLAMMAFHRITDTMAERRCGPLAAVRSVDWAAFVGFVVFKAVPFFWIPAHTVTFLLPGTYRVFLSAVLSIVLGLLQAMAKRRSKA